MNNIDQLDISKKWKTRFELLQALNADELSCDAIKRTPEFKALTTKERRLVSMNFTAFILSFFYYFYKGMHLKGLIILAISMLWVVVLSGVEFFAGVTLPNTMFWVLSSALCGMMANFDYYRHTFHQEKVWSFVPEAYRRPSTVLTLFVVSAALWGGSLWFVATHTYSTNAAYDDANAVRVPCGWNNMYATQDEYEDYGPELICLAFSE